LDRDYQSRFSEKPQKNEPHDSPAFWGQANLAARHNGVALRARASIKMPTAPSDGAYAVLLIVRVYTYRSTRQIQDFSRRSKWLRSWEIGILRGREFGAGERIAQGSEGCQLPSERAKVGADLRAQTID
jgi:hypothetical protein